MEVECAKRFRQAHEFVATARTFQFRQCRRCTQQKVVAVARVVVSLAVMPPHGTVALLVVRLVELPVRDEVRVLIHIAWCDATLTKCARCLVTVVLLRRDAGIHVTHRRQDLRLRSYDIPDSNFIESRVQRLRLVEAPTEAILIVANDERASRWYGIRAPCDCVASEEAVVVDGGCSV